MGSGYLLDASAVLALIGNEPGADQVTPLLASSSITALNLAEVVKKLREKEIPSEDILAIVNGLNIPLEPGPIDLRQAVRLGEVAAAGRTCGLSMGDCVCLAVAEWSGRIAVTAERRWKEFGSATLPKIRIQTIR